MQKGDGKKLPDGSGVVGRKEWRKIPTHGDAVGRCKNGCFSIQLEQPFLVLFCFSIMSGSLSGESMALLRKKDGSSSEKARLCERKAIGLLSRETHPLWEVGFSLLLFLLLFVARFLFGQHDDVVDIFRHPSLGIA